MIENLQRKDLNPFEEAAGIRRLMLLLNLTQEEVAKGWEKRSRALRTSCACSRWTKPLRRRILDAGLTERHARALLTVPQADRAAALEYIIEHELNVEAAERYIKLQQSSVKQHRKPKIYFKDLRIFINTIDKSIKHLCQRGNPGRREKRRRTRSIFTIPLKFPKAGARGGCAKKIG